MALKKVHAQVQKLAKLLEDDALREKVDYLETLDHYNAGGMVAARWFRDVSATIKKQVNAELDVFAHDGSDGLIAIWNVDALPEPKRPVVLLGSEGAFGVLAENFEHLTELTRAGVPHTDLIGYSWESKKLAANVKRLPAKLRAPLVRARKAFEDRFRARILTIRPDLAD